MFINLQQLEQKPVQFKLEIPTGDIDFGSSIEQSSVLHAEGTAQLISYSLGEIRTVGKLDVTMAAVCDHCLESTPFPLKMPFDLVYVPAAGASAGEIEVDQAGIEVGFYEGPGIDLNEVLREVILLALPMQFTCSESCKGICAVCGQNRNQVDCQCQQKPVDDRWNGLRNLSSIANASH